MNNIRNIRVRKEMTMRDLADKMGIHFTTIAKIERSERRLTPDWAAKFAQALEVPFSEIISDDHKLPVNDVAPRRIPVIGLVAAGQWREAVENPEDTITTSIEGSSSIFGLRVSGDSMDLVVPEGSTVMVDPQQMDLHDGCYYVIMNGENETTFKQFRTGPARLEPASTNSSHRTIPLGREPYSVVGRVVGAFRPL